MKKFLTFLWLIFHFHLICDVIEIISKTMLGQFHQNLFAHENEMIHFSGRTAFSKWQLNKFRKCHTNLAKFITVYFVADFKWQNVGDIEWQTFLPNAEQWRIFENLVKSTPWVDFINILLEPLFVQKCFTQLFSITFWLCNFLAKGYARKKRS